MDIKKKVFGSLARHCKADAILASNTSFLNIDEIAESVPSSRRGNVIGTHFLANKMQLLENVRSKYSSASTMATVQAMGKMIKKVPALVGNCDGFVGNRMYATLAAEAMLLVCEGVSPYLIDEIMVEFGWPMGLFSVSDLSGNDIGFHHRKNLGLVDNPPPNYTGRIAMMVTDLNRLGQKTGKGWYDYEGRKKKESKVVLDLIDSVLASESRVKRTDVTRQEIENRLMFCLVNEGFKILEEGIANRPLDIDVVLAFGFGFPAFRGGPMHWADGFGLKKIRDGCDSFSQRYPDVQYWRTSRLLDDCVQQRLTLAKLHKKQAKSKL